MVTVLIYLIPLIIGTIAMPTWVLLVVLLLSRGHRVMAAVSFVGGVTAVRLVQGIVFGGILSVYSLPGQRSEVRIAASILLTVTGILLWLAAVREWRTPLTRSRTTTEPSPILGSRSRTSVPSWPGAGRRSPWWWPGWGSSSCSRRSPACRGAGTSWASRSSCSARSWR